MLMWVQKHACVWFGKRSFDLMTLPGSSREHEKYGWNLWDAHITAKRIKDYFIASYLVNYTMRAFTWGLLKIQSKIIQQVALRLVFLMYGEPIDKLFNIILHVAMSF